MTDENKYNIKIECGADFVLPFTWKDDNGVPYDLTGATVRAQLRESRSSSDGIDFVCQHNGEDGRIWLTMVSEATSVIPFSYGVYDVFVDFPDRTVRPLYGDVYVQDHVTKPLDGEALFMIEVESFEKLPIPGKLNRLYFVRKDGTFYRWNGVSYIFTGVYNGIKSVEKIGTEGNYWEGVIDTYRMNFHSGDHFDYEIKNGRILYATFGIDRNTGHLMMYTPEDYYGINFRLDEESGHLFVQIPAV